MSEQIEPKKAAIRAVRMAGKMFSKQALALNGIFTSAILESAGTPSFHQDVRMALRAQAQYRATMKILLALEKERTADVSGEARKAKTEKRKHQNSSKQTIESENSSV